MLPIGQRHLGPDAFGVFQGSDVLDGAILCVARHLARPQFPAEAGAKDQVAHGLVVHHFRRCHQHLKNDTCFATVDDVVHVVAQVRAAILEAHRSSVRIGGADFEVRRPMVETMNLPLLSTFLSDPVVPCRILGSQFLVLGFGEDDGEWERCGANGDW